MKNKKLLFLWILIIFNCSNKEIEYETLKDEREENKIPVSVVKAVIGELSSYLKLNGEVDAKVKADIYADIDGKLLSLNYKVGDYVKSGAIIATLDPSKPGDFYKKSPIKSSINGHIVSFSAKVGSLVTRQSKIGTIAKLDAIQIKSYVSEKYISKLKIGSPASLEFESYEGENFNANLSAFSPIIDSNSRSVEIFLTPFGRNVNKIKIGMFGKIKLYISKSKNIKLPKAILLSTENDRFLYKVNLEDMRALKLNVGREIEIGEEADNFITITKGISEGDLIVLEGKNIVTNGSLLDIVLEKDSAPIESNLTIE